MRTRILLLLSYSLVSVTVIGVFTFLCDALPLTGNIGRSQDQWSRLCRSVIMTYMDVSLTGLTSMYLRNLCTPNPSVCLPLLVLRI